MRLPPLKLRRGDRVELEALVRAKTVEARIAADLGNSPLSITEIPQLIAGVGCR